jgi:hypothetical protein
MKNDMKQDKAMAKKAVGMHEKQLHGGKKSDLAKLKCGGKVMKKYAEGGKVEPKKPMPKEAVPDFAKDKNQDMKNQKAADNYAKTRKFAKGGAVGCEKKGKTKGRFV